MKLVRPQWVRLKHKNGNFAAEFNPTNGVIRFVDRGGTVEYNLADQMVEARTATNAPIDTTATPPR